MRSFEEIGHVTFAAVLSFHSNGKIRGIQNEPYLINFLKDHCSRAGCNEVVSRELGAIIEAATRGDLSSTLEEYLLNVHKQMVVVRDHVNSEQFANMHDMERYKKLKLVLGKTGGCKETLSPTERSEFSKNGDLKHSLKLYCKGVDKHDLRWLAYQCGLLINVTEGATLCGEVFANNDVPFHVRAFASNSKLFIDDGRHSGSRVRLSLAH